MKTVEIAAAFSSLLASIGRILSFSDHLNTLLVATLENGNRALCLDSFWQNWQLHKSSPATWTGPPSNSS